MLGARIIFGIWLNVSLILAPFSTLHAHISEADQAQVHGGHSHDFDPDHDGDGIDHVFDLKSALAHQAPTVPNWTDWVPLLLALTLAWICAPLLLSILRPPPQDTEPIPRRTFWHPPLRGPPLHSI